MSTSLRRFGIRLTLIEPGFFKTRFAANRVLAVASQTNSAYGETFPKAVAMLENNERNGADPQQLAELLARIIEQKEPKSRYRVGLAAQKLLAFLWPIVAGKILERSVGSFFKS